MLSWGGLGYGCGTGRTWAVRSKTAGNTAQGLCDMAGNAWEWIRDWYHDDYVGAPADGSAWEDPSGSSRAARGGCYVSTVHFVRTTVRGWGDPSTQYTAIGFRCAR